MNQKLLFLVVGIVCATNLNSHANEMRNLQVEDTHVCLIDNRLEKNFLDHQKNVLNKPMKEDGNILTEIIYEVEGEEKIYSDNCAGVFLYQSQKFAAYESPEAAMTIVFGDNNEVFFKDIISKAIANTYVKGIIEGDRITLSLPQTIIFEPLYGYGYNLSVLKVVEIEDENGELEYDYILAEDIDSVSYKYDPADGSMILDLPGEEGEYVLGFTWTDDQKWAYFMESKQILTPFTGNIINIPEDVEEYIFVSMDGDYGYVINVAIDEDYIYLKGLNEYAPEATIRGNFDKETGKAVISQNEYTGIYRNNFLVTKALVENPDYDPDDIFSPAYLFASDEITFILNVDIDNGIIELEAQDGIFFTFNQSAYGCSPTIVYDTFLITRQHSLEGTPVNPYNLIYTDEYINWYGYYSFMFNIPTLSTNDTLLDSKYLYYRIYIDGELMEFEYDPDNDYYVGIEGIQTDIPFDLNNNNDFFWWDKTMREVGIYIEGVSTIGVQSVYKYNGITTLSDIPTIDVETGDVTIESEINKVHQDYYQCIEYYNLNGQKVKHPEKGIFIRSQKGNGDFSKNSKVVIF